MATVYISPAAIADLIEIDDYTIDRWGEDQALRYSLKLDACFERLAVHPLLGRSCESIRPGLRRFEQGRHVIFYRDHLGGILIVRVLHDTMQPEQHISEDDEQFAPPDNDPTA